MRDQLPSVQNQLPQVNVTKREIAKLNSLSERTIDNFVARGMPVLRVSSRKLLFPLRDVDQWLRDQFLASGKRNRSSIANN